MSSILIKHGRVIDPANDRDEVVDVHIRDGRIVELGHMSPDTIDAVIDANGCWVLPGLIDLQARLREPGQEHKGTIASETAAAAKAGITTLCFPADTQPVIDTPSVVEHIRQRAAVVAKSRVLPIGALTQGLDGEQLAEMAALREAGCIAVGNARRPIERTHVLRHALEYASTLGLTVFLYPEDPWLADGCVHEGAISARLGLSGITESAEIIGLQRDLELVVQTGVRAHFCQLSTARSVSIIAEAQSRGLDVSADVSAHQLYLTEMEAGEFDSRYHLRPPLRTQRDRAGLRAGVRQGVISAICSDHQPHDVDAKLAPFAASEPGGSTLETLLPMTVRLAEENHFSLKEAIAALTCGPARILGLDGGTLSPGSVADICIFDPDDRWKVNENTLTSAGKNSPFLGWEVKGQVTHTVLAGRLVYGSQS